MPTIAFIPNIVSPAAPILVQPTITWAGATITAVTAALFSNDGIITNNGTLITNLTTLSLVSGTPNTGAVYSGLIPGSQSIKLLSNTNDTSSAILYPNAVLVISVTGTTADSDELITVDHSCGLTIRHNPTLQPLNPGPDEASLLSNEILQAIAALTPAANRNIGFDSNGDIALRANGSGGGGAITSVFGRTNPDIEAQADDYTFAQIGLKPTTLAGYGIVDAVLQTLNLIAGTGLVGGGNLTSDRTFALSAAALASLALADSAVQPGAIANFETSTQLDSRDTANRSRANHIGSQSQSTISGLTTTLDAKADLVGGVIPTAQIPALAISQYLGSVADEAAMLALIGQSGDWCTRQDTASPWMLTDSDATQLSNWIQFVGPAAPVSSVNGQTGSVTLGADDVGAETPAQLDSRDAANRDRANHTGTQPLSTISDAGTAAAQDAGTAIGDVVQVEDVAGNPGLPALDGSQLTNLPAPTSTSFVWVDAAASLTSELITNGNYTLTGVPQDSNSYWVECLAWTGLRASSGSIHYIFDPPSKTTKRVPALVTDAAFNSTNADNSDLSTYLDGNGPYGASPQHIRIPCENGQTYIAVSAGVGAATYSSSDRRFSLRVLGYQLVPGGFS